MFFVRSGQGRAFIDVTKQAQMVDETGQADASPLPDPVGEIVVTPAMISEGANELHEYRYGCDMEW